MWAVFVARYPGRCGECDQAIRPGDRAKCVEHELTHATCPEVTGSSMSSMSSMSAEPCQRCFMVPATNGTCGCEVDA